MRVFTNGSRWLSLLLSILCYTVGIMNQEVQFNLIQGPLCIRDKNVISVPSVTTNLWCAWQCSIATDCQAFSLATGNCRLFVFNRCSRPLESCNCNRTGSVYVRRQAGAVAGRLCADEYADYRCGLNYRVVNGSKSWTSFQALSLLEPNLGGFADVLNAEELSWVFSVSVAHASSFFLSGAQLPESPEPNDGFMWSRCNTSVDRSLFLPGEPDNRYGEEHYVGVYFDGSARGLVDVPAGPYNTALFMCVSPFG